MRTSVLVSFFKGLCDSKTLAEDLSGTTTKTSQDTFVHKMEDDFSEEFLVEVQHLVRICDAFELGELDDQMVEEIGFALMVSDYFNWDSGTPAGDLVSATVDNWCSREISYQINKITMNKFRHYLLTGEDTFCRDDLSILPQKGSKRIWNAG